MASSLHLVKSILPTESVRNEASFDAILKIILKNKDHPEISLPVLLQKRHAPIRLEVDEAEPDYPNTVQERHRRLYYKAVGLIHSIRSSGKRAT